MIEFIIAILLSTNPKPHKIQYVNYCKKDFTNFSLDHKIELGIACSSVYGKRAYPNKIVKEIYEEAKRKSSERN